MRKMLKFNLIKSLKISLSIILLFAIYLSYIGGYGSDEDTLPMIGVFEAILNSGGIMTSRFTGYPVAEFGIGFLLLQLLFTLHVNDKFFFVSPFPLTFEFMLVMLVEHTLCIQSLIDLPV